MSNTIISQKFAEKDFVKDSKNYAIQVNYKIHSIGNAESYFSITTKVFCDGGLESAGFNPNLIQEHFPELFHLVKWHLTAVNTGPIHYIANSLFWWKRYLGNHIPLYKGDKCPSGKEALTNFKSCCVYGVTEYDNLNFENDLSTDYINNWLKERFEKLMHQFHSDMKKAELE